ncbi:roadblock/LC7 domain-containing protein [Nonomuraea sp. K274]|uniref:Roadblock/LC7 domain-containing protein n=1 Tax=Nonomuraea cypriaca TaxID=1187855 RepID=A0A931AHP2_9ACTN|nr:roadblock/LC7 domain-containing protein [Nonomuraea cypriaca]MBF8190683.1 roadblock/LC7 domain-containing protein [Nonomuraea cypriaca]
MPGIGSCLTEIMSIPGALDAMLVDQTSGMAVAFSGPSGVDADRAAAALAEVLRATAGGLARSCPGDVVRVDDMIVTTDKGHHLLTPLETAVEGPLVIYVRLDLERSEPVSARRLLRSIAGRLTT